MIDHPHLLTQQPEWRRSGRFFLIALGLHAAVLFSPLPRALSTLTSPEAASILVKLVRPAAHIPAAVPQETPKTPPPAAPQPRPKAVPVLATTPDTVANPVTAASAPVPPAAPAASSPAPASPPAPVTVSAARFDVAYLNNPHPEYPPISRRLGEEGKVLLRVRVNAEGRPTAVELEKSSNFDRLDEAAKRSVSRWRFVPAKRGDEAIEATVIVPVVFRLDN